jgi:hypothetical protein
VGATGILRFALDDILFSVLFRSLFKGGISLKLSACFTNPVPIILLTAFSFLHFFTLGKGNLLQKGWEFVQNTPRACGFYFTYQN